MMILSSIKDVVVTLAAATTAIVAVLGLNSWRQELKGRTEFDVARKLAFSTYRLRNAMRACRSALIAGAEFPPGYGVLGTRKSSDEEASAWAYVYQNRWKPVWEALQEFETNSLEAEALWGTDISTSTNQFRSCVIDLNVAIESLISDKASGGEDFKYDKDFAKEVRGKLFGRTNDPLSQQIGTAIKSIEGKLRPHLARKSNDDISLQM